MLSDQYGFLEDDFQLVIAIVLLVTVLEGARRAIGWPLPIVAALALAYGLYGQHIPGEFGHSGTPTASFLGTLTIAEGGIWGSLTGVSVNVVAIFVIFGAVLNAGEAGQGFMNVAAAAAGRLKGGAAKVSRAVLRPVRFDLRIGLGQCRLHGRDHPAGDDQARLPEAACRRGRGSGLVRRPDHAAADGGRGLCHGRTDAGALHPDHGGGALLPAILYFFAVWVGINAYARRFDLASIDRERPAVAPRR